MWCNTKWHPNPSSRLATTDMGRKLGAVPLLGKMGSHPTQCCLGRGLPTYQMESWSMQPFGNNRDGPKIGGLCLLFGGGELGPHLAQCGLDRGPPACQVPSWSIQPFSHSRHGQKIGGALSPFWEGELGPHLIQCRLGRGLLPYQIASWSIQPFGHSRYGPKIGGEAVPNWGRGSWSPCNTMWPGPWPTCMASFIFIHPTVWPQYNQRYRQTRQTERTNNGLIA